MDEPTSEQQLRQEAIRRHLLGERRCDICDDLQRDPSWFSKWWNEFQCHPETNFADQSRAPHASPQQTAPEVEQAIVRIRRTLEAAETAETRYGFIGQRAIQARLDELRIRPLPSLATIQRILARHGLTHPQGAATDAAYYPEAVAPIPNGIHATDIITRHVRGGEVIQNFHTIDHYTHAIYLSQHSEKGSATARAHLLASWAALGLPRMEQLDNEDCFKGGHTHARVIGQVVRLCLFVGIQVLFIPEYEGKRNYWIEGFHSLWVSGFWSRQEFRNLEHVQTEAPTFKAWYLQHYRPPSLQGLTPAQMRRGSHPIELTAALRRLIPDRLPITAGQIHFQRKVDTLGAIRLLNETWYVGKRWIGEYVWATMDTAEQTLNIWHKADTTAPWRHIKTRPFRLKAPVEPLLPAFRRNCLRCREQWVG
jgi:putative transposase